MTEQEKATLKQQIESDPRVQQMAQQTGFLSAGVLQQLGYDVPSTAVYRTGLNGRSGAGLTFGDGFWGGVAKAIPIAAGAVGSLGVGSMLSGAGAASQAGGATAGAIGGEAGTLAGGAIPGWATAGMAGPGAIASQGASAGLGSVLPKVASGGLTGALKGLVSDPSNLMDLGGLITALIGGTRGGGGQVDQGAQQLNQMTQDRMRRVDPLHQAVTQLAWGRLPTNARQGIAPPTYKPLS